MSFVPGVALISLMVLSPQVPKSELKARSISSPTAKVGATRTTREGRFAIRLTPRDALGRELGAGRVEALGLVASAAHLIGKLTDLGDGAYEQTLELAPGAQVADVDLEVSVLGVPSVVPLALALETRMGEGDPRLERLIEHAREDLAGRIGVSGSDAVEVLEASWVAWRDASGGCPRAEMAYAQVVTEGSRIRLRHAGQVYDYHGVGELPPRLCATPEGPIPVRTR